MDQAKNFAHGTVSVGYNASAVSITLTGGHGVRFPDPASGAFNLVWWNVTDYPNPADDPKVEIVRCTARITDTLTIARAQEGTAASTKNTTGKAYKVILAFTSKVYTDLIALIATKNDTLSFPIAVAQGGTGSTTKEDAAIALDIPPIDATYILQTANARLPNAQSLSDLAIGYMISNAGVVTVNPTVPFSDVSGLPVTLAGYGITDAFTGIYADLIGKPTLFSGAYADLSGKPDLFSGVYADLTAKPTLFDGVFASLTSKPSTLSGYGITDAQAKSEKDTANGYAGLDAFGKMNPSQLPAIAITNTYVVGSQIDMLALAANTGDVAIRTDENKSYILRGANPAVLGDWSELLAPVGAVASVFGRAGVVTAQNGDYTTAIVPDSADKRYVTDAALAILLNTSGINTGDQTITLTGHVTGTGVGSFATTIGAGIVTNVMLAGSIDLATKMIGILPVANGGTGTSTSFTQGSVVFAGASGAYGQDNSNFYWDDTNKRLGLGGVPTTRLHVKGTQTLDIARIDIGIDMNPVLAPVGATVSLIAAAGNVEPGTHYYYVTYLTALGETEPANANPWPITTDAGHGQVSVGLPISSDYRVTGRRIYRTKSGFSYWNQTYIVTTINNNTDTTYVDNIHDASLSGTGIGYYARDNTTCKYIRTNMLSGMIMSPRNTFFGSNAGASTATGAATGGFNIGIGLSAAVSLSDGSKNVAIGSAALYYCNQGYDNVAIGDGAGSAIRSAGGNITIGRNTAGTLGYGGNNTYVGQYAGFGNGGSVQTQWGNTVIGATAGYFMSFGTYNTLLGTSAGGILSSGNFNTAIGAYSAFVDPTASAQLNICNLIFGTGAYATTVNSSTPTAAGRLGIGKNDPTAWLHLKAGAAASNSAPLKFTSGTLLTTPESGAIEFDGTNFYATISGVRKTLVLA